MKRWGLVIRVQEGGLRRITTLTEQSKCPNVWFAIQGNILGDSIDKDTHHEGIRQRGTVKYLRESYCHLIEYFVANS